MGACWMFPWYHYAENVKDQEETYMREMSQFSMSHICFFHAGPYFPSVWHTVHATSLYEQQGLCSSFAMEEDNGILFFFSPYLAHQILLQKSLFLIYLYCPLFVTVT